MRILITGSNGLLGQKIVKQCLKHNLEFIATSKGENRNADCPAEKYVSMDICNKLEINHIFQATYPTHVIHTAAITNVDYCELNPEECHEVNVQATQYLFEASKQYKAHFELLSTDFVFDGLQGMYKETDEVNPLSVYAQSKVDAENILLQSDYTNWSIARTIIVYGTANNLSRTNIVLWAIDALQKQQPMNIINDQFRMPTWADDLAWGCLEICRRNKTGIFHLSGPELLAINQIVERIAVYLGKSMENVNLIDSSTLNQPAKRPPRTGFDLSKSRAELGYNPKTIEETLKELVS
ncbi:MAG TPA: SDR family oxidoreductase [Crocinitomicaceae bacterium]|nr:SDR family oxidoreductase [Crocinitomicaceae bacterium]